MRTATDLRSTPTCVSPTFTRRVLAKAAAGFAAATAFASATPQSPPSAIAQGSSTSAGEWWEADQPRAMNDHGEFVADIPFRAIAPHWSGESGIHGAVEISVSADGSNWETPVVVGPAHTDAGPADRDGRTYGQLMMTNMSQYVRYRTLDANGTPAALPGLAFTYIDASMGPTVADVASPAIGGPLVKPPTITRDQWGASLAYGGWDGGTSQWPAEYRTVEHIIVHHSVTPQFRDPLVEIRSIHYYHAVTRGWGDIGYNYLVDYLGNVYEGRKGGENVVGGHAFQYAYGSSGICSMGSFGLESSTPEAIAALVWITAWVGRNLDPLGRKDFHETPNLPTICAHRDVNDSTCPGDALYADLPYIRTAVAEVIAGIRNADIPSGYGPGDVIQVTVNNANLREKPDISGGVQTRLPLGKIMTVIEGPTTNDGYSWYRVSGEQSAGWLAATTFGPSSAPPPARDFPPNTRVEIAANTLNLRSGPGLWGSVVARLPQGDIGTVIEGPESSDGFDWLKLDTNLGTGWAAKQFLAPSGRTQISSRFTVGDTVRVADGGLNMRTEASTSARIITQLSEGATGTVTDGPRRSAGFNWVQIRTDGGTGWVAEEYLEEASAPAPDPVNGQFDIGDRIVVDTDALNMRSSAGLSGSVVSVLWTGTDGTVVDGPVDNDNYLWYRIETSSGTGWVAESFIGAAGSSAPPASGFEPGTSIEVTTGSLNLRSSASTSASVVRLLTRGETGSVVGGSTQVDGYTWVEARFGGSTGWVATAYIGRATGSPSYSGDLAVGMDAASTTNNLNVRTSPSLTAGVAGQIFDGDEVTIVDGPVSRDGYTWFRVDGRYDGWVVEVWLEPTAGGSIGIGSTVRVFDGELNMRSGPSTSNGIVHVLPDGAIVEVIDGPDWANGYEWYRVTSSRYGTGWVVAAWLERV